MSHYIRGSYPTESGANLDQTHGKIAVYRDRDIWRESSFFGGQAIVAQRYCITGDITGIEIVYADSDRRHPIFLPDAGQCERIGMPIVAFA